MSLQTLGGYGYLKEYPVEQYVRDNKIASIYEGTNGIQALDLVARKLPAKGGEDVRNLVGVLTAFTEAHGGHPVLTWMAGNLVARQDPAGNIKPDKAKSTEKIDGMVALIMAVDRALRHEEQAPSVYEGRGILTI